VMGPSWGGREPVLGMNAPSYPCISEISEIPKRFRRPVSAAPCKVGMPVRRGIAAATWLSRNRFRRARFIRVCSGLRKTNGPLSRVRAIAAPIVASRSKDLPRRVAAARTIPKTQRPKMTQRTRRNRSAP